MRTKKIVLNEKTGSSLTCYLQDFSKELKIEKRPAMLIFPGGAYSFCSDREGEPIALSYLAEGYNCFVLRYSTGGENSFKTAMDDAERAMKIIVDNSDEWFVDGNKIVVIGFSAGGHLAAMVGTTGTNRPSAMILAYPCIMADSIGSILAFPVPSANEMVDAKTPPAFIFATADDELVPIKNSLEFASTLDRNSIPFELHVFHKGVHGLSLGKKTTFAESRDMINASFSRWFTLSTTWLEDILNL